MLEEHHLFAPSPASRASSGGGGGGSRYHFNYENHNHHQKHISADSARYHNSDGNYHNDGSFTPTAQFTNRLYSDAQYEGVARKRPSGNRRRDSACDGESPATTATAAHLSQYDEDDEYHSHSHSHNRTPDDAHRKRRVAPRAANTPANSSITLWMETMFGKRVWRKVLCCRPWNKLSLVGMFSGTLALVVVTLSLLAASAGAAAWWFGVFSPPRVIEVSLPIPLSDGGIPLPSPSASLLWTDTVQSRPVDSNSPPVHVIASCADRLSTLLTCLPTWLSVPEVSSVTIVDWGSAEPLHISLRDQLISAAGKVRIVELSEPMPWMLSTSVNLALHFVPLDEPSLLLKVDCDTVLQPSFVQSHPLSENDFYAGDWKVARDENELHLNGVLFIHTASFLRVNGYDERLQSYGYDDTNLHERLEAAHIAPHPLHYDHIQHLKHDDSVRQAKKKKSRVTESEEQQAQPASDKVTVADFNSQVALTFDQLIAIAPPFFATQLHRVLLDKVPKWNNSMSGATFHVSHAAEPHLYQVSVQKLPTRLEEAVSKEDWLAAMREAAEITLRRVGVRIDELPVSSDLAAHVHHLLRLMCFWTSDSEQQALVVHVQHGLSNRLRALASAAAVAASLAMPLKVVWLPDHHCAARFSDLFRVRSELSALSLAAINSTAMASVAALRSQDVWEDPNSSPALHLLSEEKFDVYNYMEPEKGAVKNAPILSKKGSLKKSVYVKSAYRLWHDAGLSDDGISRALSSLVLSEPVVAVIGALRQPHDAEKDKDALIAVEAGNLRVPSLDSAIGVHIRHSAPANEVAGLQSKEYPTAAWSALAAAREMSSVDVYAAAMRNATLTAQAAAQQHFYVSSDSPDIVEQLQKEFGADRVTHLNKESCDDRSVRCTRQALVDQLLLGQTSRLLGSVWSSYSEVAALWRQRPVDYPPGLLAAVERAYNEAESAEANPVAASRPNLLTSDLLTAPFTDPRISAFALPQSARSAKCRIELVSLLGERCSGTSYLQRLLESNFQVSNTDDYHYRHFFGFDTKTHPLDQAGCVLFVGVIRAPVEWMDCLYKYQWQLDQWRYPDWPSFLTQPIVSYAESEMNHTLSLLPESERPAAREAMLAKPIWHDRNFADPQLPEWRDVFQLRHVKAAHMIDTFPGKVSNYVMVRLEDLQANYQHFLHILQLWFNLTPKSAQSAAAITAESSMPAYVDAEMDYDVVNTEAGPLNGREHSHISPQLAQVIWQKLDEQLEQRIGYKQGDEAHKDK